jgi:hypothetical protein
MRVPSTASGRRGNEKLGYDEPPHFFVTLL